MSDKLRFVSESNEQVLPDGGDKLEESLIKSEVFEAINQSRGAAKDL